MALKMKMGCVLVRFRERDEFNEGPRNRIRGTSGLSSLPGESGKKKLKGGRKGVT